MKRRIDYDLDYLRHWSLGLDVWIILRTPFVMLRGAHAY
jgi:putative colanic acid biosynthesis UDP-glucose lipid carrier transferase